MTPWRDGQGKEWPGKTAVCWEGANLEAENLPDIGVTFSGYRGEIGRILERDTKV